MGLKSELKKAHRHTSKAIERLQNVQSLVEQSESKAGALEAPLDALGRVRATIVAIAHREGIDTDKVQS